MLPVRMGSMSLSGTAGRAVSVVWDDKGGRCGPAGGFSQGRLIKPPEHFRRVVYSVGSDFSSSAVVFEHQPAVSAFIGTRRCIRSLIACGYFYLLHRQVHI